MDSGTPGRSDNMSNEHVSIVSCRHDGSIRILSNLLFCAGGVQEKVLCLRDETSILNVISPLLHKAMLRRTFLPARKHT